MPLTYNDDDIQRQPSLDPQPQRLSSSPSVQPGEKRPCSDGSDSESEEVVQKAQKINERSGRPKASDYEGVDKELIAQANTIYRCLLSTENGFPELVAETELVKLAWEDANEQSGLHPKMITPRIAKIVSRFLISYNSISMFLLDQGPWIANSWRSQGEDKTICRNHVWFREWP
jgi:hypothetical protein